MKSQLQLIIIVDTNDADFSTSINDVTEEQIKQLTPLLEKAKEIGNLWSFDIEDVREQFIECFGEDQVELFEEYFDVPSFGESDIDTIKIVKTQIIRVF